MPKDPETLAHLEWLGYVQPVGLVVSVPAMLAAQAHVNRNIAPDQQRFLTCLPRDKDDEPIPEIRNFAEFTQTVLGWKPADLQKVNPDDRQFAPLTVPLPAFHETLAPTYAVREFQPRDANRPWMLLVKVLPAGASLDDVAASDERHWQATPQAKFERLLRETEIPAGLLSNGTHLRLVYAPRGETSGFMTFSVTEMLQVAGRPIFAALHTLLCVERVFGFGLAYPEKQRLTAILADSRKYQNVVSNQLAEQVLAALYELVRGLQAADEQRRGELLREVLASDPNHVYAGLLTVLMRLVFILFAEDRGLLSSDPVYSNFYSITGLFERLRADAGHYPDTMDQRYGAWAQLLTLFRLVYDGGRHGNLKIPPRRGYLFDPDRYNFLEGRPWQTARRRSDQVDVPRMADGVIYRVLEKLLILDGERLSYRTLDVEQIGSVYETMMGFNLEVAQGRSIAVKPTKAHGAPAAINLDELLAAKPTNRPKWLTEKSDQKVTGQVAEALKSATSIESLLAALDRKIAHHATPNVVPQGAMVLQPSDERRRSGSHYTPRSLTEPIVRTTLKPILEQLGKNRRPDQILTLKVCDPAMGSGAFLVEACRQLGDALVEAWHVHNCVPVLPPDEDEVLHARRLIAQRCLYGVDMNPMAVDLSKLSLWLVTLAKDHPFTFLDHSLRPGDSLVGLSREQIAAFHWQPAIKRDNDRVWFGDPIAAKLRTVTEYRQRILAARDDKPYEQLRQELDVADEALSLARLTGDCVIAAYFSAGKDHQRVAKLDTLSRQLVKYIGPHGKIEDRKLLSEAVASLHRGDPQSGNRPLQPFHWQIEFPEVFTVDPQGKSTGGFDAIVGNPPFLGGNQISTHCGMPYFSWLTVAYSDTGGICDLVAYFFRRAFAALASNGTFGLIATKTIAEGETRIGGLKWIREHSGNIYAVRKRLAWPGAAAVIVSVLHVKNGAWTSHALLNGKPVSTITSYLFDKGGDGEPAPLSGQNDLFSQGTNPRSPGFIFCDGDLECTPISTVDHIRRVSPNEAMRILPYLGGEEINQSPTQTYHRFIIFLDDIESEEELLQFPLLAQIVREKVKPGRDELGDNPNNVKLRRRWWAYHAARHDFYGRLRLSASTLVNTQVGNHVIFAMQPTDRVFALTLNVYDLQTFGAFCVLQSRPHDVWARFFGSHMKDDLRYTPSTCFETFPFPLGVLEHAADNSLPTDNCHLTTLESAGRNYYDFRAAFMVRNNEGLTKTYNRFHDRDHDATESSREIVAGIQKLRELHAEMDRGVLEAYGWHDLAETATFEFLLDYEDEDEDEQEGTGTGKKKKKPWRYRWPDDFRDEVLARLLDLNKQRAEEERLSGQAAEAVASTAKKKRVSHKKAKKKNPGQPELRGL